MYSREEQVQAHRFSIRRVTYALTSGEPENNDLFLRRGSIGMFTGVVILALILAGIFVVGKIKQDQCRAKPSPTCVAPAQK